MSWCLAAFFGIGLLAAGIILAIMILPTITSISRDVLLAVPSTQREAMLALGATRWEATSRAVIPYARSGIVGGVNDSGIARRQRNRREEPAGYDRIPLRAARHGFEDTVEGCRVHDRRVRRVGSQR